MVKLQTDLKTYSHEISVSKFNLMDLSLATIENEIEYLLFVEHEEAMKDYTHLRPFIAEIAKICVNNADRAVAEYQRDITIKLAENLKDKVQEIVYGQKFETREKRRVDTTINDEGVVGTQVVAVGAPLPTFEDEENDW
jgi:hypothetical protein